MAERDQFVRALGRHDAGEARGAEHVALLGVALADDAQGLRVHDDAALGAGDALGHRLVGDVDHVGRAARVEMAEARHRVRGRRGIVAVSREQPARRRRHVGFAHQALADEDGAHADLRQTLDIVRAKDAALADDDAVARHQRRQRLGHGERDVEGAQVAVVDADEPGAEGQGALELAGVVHLDERVHAERVRRLDESGRRFVTDARHDDEDAVGAPGARLEHLVGLEQEILAQDGQAGGLAGLRQIFGTALRTRARPSAPTGRRRRPRHRPGRGAADRNRRGSGRARGSPS